MSKQTVIGKARIIEVVEIRVLRGDGKLTPTREVFQYWTKEGGLLAEKDSYAIDARNGQFI